MAQKKDESSKKWYFYGKYKKDGEYINYKKRGYNTKREAILAEQLFLEEVMNAKDEILFSDLVEKYFDFAIPRTKKSTLKNDSYTMGKWVDKFGNCFLSEINRYSLQEWMDELDQSFSKRYVQKIYYMGNKLFKWAILNDYTDTNPLMKIQLNERPNEFKKEMKFWEKEDFDKFISVVDDPMWKAFFSTLFYMGMRRGEVMALFWTDIDFQTKTIRIDKTTGATERKEKRKYAPPKTKNSYRTITMPDILVESLRVWLNVEQRYKNFALDESFVFGCEIPLAPETIRRVFRNYIKLANEQLPRTERIPIIRIHDLRHSHASYLINNMSYGFTDFDVAKRLGDTVETLHDTYAHWFKRKDENIVDFMNHDTNRKDSINTKQLASILTSIGVDVHNLVS